MNWSVFRSVQVWKYRFWTLVRCHRLGMECISRLTKQKPGLLDKSEVQTMPVVCYEPHIHKNAIRQSSLQIRGDICFAYDGGVGMTGFLSQFPGLLLRTKQRHMNSNFKRHSRYNSIHITIEHVWISPNHTPYVWIPSWGMSKIQWCSTFASDVCIPRLDVYNPGFLLNKLEGSAPFASEPIRHLIIRILGW